MSRVEECCPTCSGDMFRLRCDQCGALTKPDTLWLEPPGWYALTSMTGGWEQCRHFCSLACLRAYEPGESNDPGITVETNQYRVERAMFGDSRASS